MRYAKFIVGIIGAAVIAIQTALTDGVITSAEWGTIALAVLTALGVWGAPNKPATRPHLND